MRPAKRPVAARRSPGAERLLFPLAAAFAAAAIPIWLTQRLTTAVMAPGAWHAHEMLFGYALAVVAGFLVTRPGGITMWTLVATWLAARLAPTVDAYPVAFIAALSFPAALLAAAVPPLLHGAKRWENRIAPAVIAALLLADIFWWVGALWRDPEWQFRAALVAVDLLALLILIVGGRALPAAVGGYLERQGIARRDPIRRGYELPLAMLMGAACAFDAAGMGAAAGWLGVGAALVTLRRAIRWQLHRTLARPELWTLALGYLWLIAGLLIKGVAQASGALGTTADALHGLTVGALGTVTLVMMARTALLRARRPLERFADMAVAAVLVSAAALLRLLAPGTAGHYRLVLWLAAASWSVAFLLLLARLLRTGDRRAHLEPRRSE